MNPESSPWLFLLIPVYFVSLWLLVTTLLSIPWLLLQKEYAATQEPDGQKFLARRLALGMVRYNNCATVFVAPGGLYLRVARILCPWGKPLFIPWERMDPAKITSFLWSPCWGTRIHRTEGGSIRLTLAGSVLDALED